MKRLRRLTVIAFTVLFLVAVGYYGHKTYNAIQGRDGAQAEQIQAYRSHWLSGQDRVRYSLQAGKRHVRLLLNAALDPAMVGEQGIDRSEDHFYSIRYRLYALDGRLVDERIYHVPLHVEARNGMTRRALLQHNAIPTNTSEIRLNLDTPADATHLELSIGPSALPLSGLAVRPYYQERRDAGKLDRIWQRLHADKKLNAARYNVLDVEFLTEAERNNLVRWRWRPLVPVGIEDEDFTVAVLTDTPVNEFETAAEVQPRRWLLPAGRSVTIGLRHPAQLLVTAAGPSDLSVHDLQADWAGRFSYERRQLPVTLPDAGLLQIKAAAAPGIVRLQAKRDLWLEAADQSAKLTLEPTTYLVRAYPLGIAGALVLPVRHAGNAATPIRLDLRGEPAHGEELQLTIQLRGNDGHSEVYTQRVAVTPSTFDWLYVAGSPREISDNSSVYLNVPGWATELHLSSDTAAWVSAYNRPPGYARHMLIPEALFGGDEHTALLPNWFVLKPANAEQLDLQGASALLHSQLSWPDESVDPQQQVSERLLPIEPNAGTSILTANHPEQEIQPTGYGATFKPLHAGPQQVTISGPDAHPVEPTLLLRDHGASEANVVIRNGGQTLLDLHLSAGTSGRAKLPALRPGSYQWLVEAPPGVDLWLSHQRGPHPTWREHAVQAVPDDRYTYHIDRRMPNQELLALRVFSDSPGRIRMSVSMPRWQRTAGPSKAWTPDKAIYDLLLQPEADATAPMRSGEMSSWYSAVAFHALDVDVPVQPLIATVALEQTELDRDGPARVYIGLTRTSTSAPDTAPIRIQRFEVSQR